jgi:hypothetical protein
MFGDDYGFYGYVLLSKNGKQVWISSTFDECTTEEEKNEIREEVREICEFNKINVDLSEGWYDEWKIIR